MDVTATGHCRTWILPLMDITARRHYSLDTFKTFAYMWLLLKNLVRNLQAAKNHVKTEDSITTY